MKKRLVILSDLWGKEKSEWVINYIQILKQYFDVKYYDCCGLGDIDKSDYTEESLHKQFLNGGIERAVEKLIKIEKEKVTVLGFSIGGTIAWKYGVKTGKTDSLTCVSATRLRYETIKPEGKTTLYFGSEDSHKPKIEWLDNMVDGYSILSEQGHTFYMQPEFAGLICKGIIENI